MANDFCDFCFTFKDETTTLTCGREICNDCFDRLFSKDLKICCLVKDGF